jgi:phenylacetate-CoA ligase
MPTPAAALAWQFQDRLEASQWWSAGDIRARQFQMLAPLLRHAVANVPWYQRALAGLDLRGRISEAAWQAVPILTRAELQAHADDLAARTYPEAHGAANQTGSSGSTGRPVMVTGTDLTQNWHRALTLRAQLWWTSRFDRTLATIRRYKPGVADYPEGATAPHWGDELTIPILTGPVAMLGIHVPVHEQVEWLGRIDPDLLLTYPSNLLAICDHARRHDVKLPRLKGIMTLGESLLPDSRATARQTFGAAIFDVYSANEAGYIALQCPSTAAYHVQAEAALVEILDDAGRPCPVGATGRVVLTLLHNYAMPLIRYEIGDFATVGAPCACGRGLPALAKIVGRQRNLLVLPDGTRVAPSFGARELRKVVPFEQFQFVQHAPDRLELRVVIPRELTAEEEAIMRRDVLSRLPVPMTVTVTRVAEIPRGPGGKYEILVSLAEAPAG